MERYVVRKEFFGGLVYDRKEDTNIIIDEEFWLALESLVNGIDMFDDETITFFKQEEFLATDGKHNYKLINNGYNEEILSAPGRVHFYYTKECNLNCLHCFTKDSNPETEMSFEEKISMLDQMEMLGVNEILIGGGEPFMKEDFPLFVEESLKRNIVTKVFTNGLLINDDMIERMKDWNIKYMSISIDGCTEEEYQYVRGVAGLSYIRKLVKKLKEICSFTVAASVTVNSQNYNTAEQILELVNSIGFQRLKVRPVKPSGNVYRNKNVFPTDKQYAEFIRTAQKIWNKKYKNEFTLDFSWGDTRLVYDESTDCIDALDISYPYEGYGCFAGKVNIVIDSGGRALTCGFLPDEFNISNEDNLKEKALKQIWDNGKCFNKLRGIPGNTACKNCKYYAICRGGCMARNLFYGFDINKIDPWCLKKHFPLYIGTEND